MRQKVKHLIHAATDFYSRHRGYVLTFLALLILIPTLLLVVCHFIIAANAKYILAPGDLKHERVGLVLGAGITTNGKPFKELQARLDVAAKAIDDGQVDKLVLSGDNRFKNYNEPKAMEDYLVNIKHISVSKLQPDYAGRDTYESCERASRIFGLHETIIFSAPSHLPRAIYLCRHLNVTAFGISSGVDGNNSWRRELLAAVKAVLNIYIYREPTVLGKPIHV